MNSRSHFATVGAGMFLLILCQGAFAHHVAFCSAVSQALEKSDIASLRHLFEDTAWSGTDEAMSAAALQERLKRGDIVPLTKSSDLKFDEYSSNDKFDNRSRCILTFKIKHSRKTEQVYLLAKRVRDDGYTNPKAWRIWRIVTDQKQAECFLGQKISRRE